MNLRASRPIRAVLATLGLVVAWAGLVFAGTSEGWWKTPLAPRGDAARFLEAAARRVDSANAGNAVFALIENGAVRGVHSVSVGDAVDTSTAFQVASLSKWVTAWGVMTLVEAGRVDLDAPVERYLTRWKLPPSRFSHDKVTVRRLLSHTAGLTDGLGYAGFEPGTPVQSIEASLTRTGDRPPGNGVAVTVGAEPGSGWQYSGGGYSILQLLIEEVSGESFETYLQRAVLRPLGMVRSTFQWTPESGTALATFYGPDGKPAPHYRFAAVAAASLYTTVADLTRFLQAQVPGQAGEPAGRGVLSPATLAEMWKPHAAKYGQDIWGLGVLLYAPNQAGGHVVGHDGNNDPAINTTARVNPATRNGIVVLETGNRLLASELAGEWVFWETGNVDTIAFLIGAPRMLRVMGLGAVVIVAGAIGLAVRRRRSRPEL